MSFDGSADPPKLNEETPSLDTPVAVEWWHDFYDTGDPKLDTHHGFHDAERVADGTPPAMPDGEIVTEYGTLVDADSEHDDIRESHHLYLTHREALARDISPCVECFPVYATERRLTEAREGGILTKVGVTGAVFPIWTRYDQDSGWDLDSVHNSYRSLLYRTHAIREHAESVGGRLRYRFMPVRRCDYSSFEEAAAVEPMIMHATDLRTIQPEELNVVRKRFGDEFVSTSIEYESRFTDTGETRASLIHRAKNPPCGYERERSSGFAEDAEEAFRELLDSESQTVADVIERGNIVEFCESCFPELAAWNATLDE